MCGRFGLWPDPQEVQSLFQLQEPLPLEPRYNIAPGQEILAIGQGSNQVRKASSLLWGLVPHWAKESKTGYKMINARAESLWSKPAYKAAARRRRCLIPASCFFEWKRKEQGAKQPYCIRPKNGDLFAFAGIWEHWEDSQSGQAINSCAIVTTHANEAVSELHDRMPVIVSPGDYEVWLDRRVEQSENLQGLLEPCPSGELEIYPVSTEVNSPKNDHPGVVEPEGDKDI